MECKNCAYWDEDNRRCIRGDEGCVDDYELEPEFNYTLFYVGKVYDGDTDGLNQFHADNFNTLATDLYMMLDNGIFAEIRDNKYGMVFNGEDWY